MISNILYSLLRFLFTHPHRVMIGLGILLSLPLNAQQEFRDSLAVASKELSFHPDSVDLRLRKATWNIMLKQWEYAIEEYSYVLKREPKNVAALFYRAYSLENLHKYKFARIDYESVLAIVPGHYEASLGLALLNHKDKHFSECMGLLNQLCLMHPERSEAFAARANIEYEQKEYTVAEFDISEALRIEPDNTDYLLTRANILINNNKKEEARTDLDHLVLLGVPRPALQPYYKLTE